MIFISGIGSVFISFFLLNGHSYFVNILRYLGLGLAIGSLIYGSILMNLYVTRNGKLITSILTPIYKYYLPTLILEILLFNTVLFVSDIYPGNDISIFLLIEIMLFIWLLLLIPCFKLKQLSVRNKNFIATDYFKTIEFNAADIVKVNRFCMLFFKVKLDSGSFVVFPKLLESLDLFNIPKSIRLLINSGHT